MAQPSAAQQDTRRLLRRISTPPQPDDPTANYSFTLSWTGSQLDYVEKTINGETWRKTLTWTGSNLTAVSAWVLQ